MVSFNTTDLAVLLVPAAVIGCIPAFIAKSKGRSFLLWWIYGFALLIVAIIHAIVLKPNEQALLDEGMKKCPFCAEMIKPDAKVCRYCSRDLPEKKIATENLSPYQKSN